MASRVVDTLLRYGGDLDSGCASTRARLSSDEEVVAYLHSNPFALLVGVICQYGVSAEWAWGVPARLKGRLGHLDPVEIAGKPDAVRDAFRGPPALHRFVNTVPGWVVEAAGKVVAEYGGEAGAIWAGAPRAVEVTRRLRSFPGIGQKKASLAVLVLIRDLHRPIRGLEGSDIAYDVHLRRVFLRTGLARSDDRNEMVSAARRAHPEWPGALHRPAWYVGRRWCHSGLPRCAECVLSSCCPGLVEEGTPVQGP